MMLIVTQLQTSFGWLELGHDENHLYSCKFIAPPIAPLSSNSVFDNLIQQELEAYHQNPQYRFNIKLNPQGSTYQQRVWSALRVIPAGRTMTYGDLAKQIQSGPRAIGQACKKNPIALFIPCHRIVGQHDLGGYMGKSKALSFKTALLAHESGRKLKDHGQNLYLGGN